MEDLVFLFDPFIALSLAASMFEGSGSDSENLADIDTDLYILGIKYRTPNGNY